MIFRRTPAAGPKQRPQLGAQQAGAVEPEPDGAPAQGGIFLFKVAHVRQQLVAADIERAEGHRLAAGGVQNRAVQRILFAVSWEAWRDHELQFGTEQADTARAGIVNMRQVDAQPGIKQQVYFLAVLGYARFVAQCGILLLPPRAQPDALDIGRFHVRQRPDV